MINTSKKKMGPMKLVGPILITRKPFIALSAASRIKKAHDDNLANSYIVINLFSIFDTVLLCGNRAINGIVFFSCEACL